MYLDFLLLSAGDCLQYPLGSSYLVLTCDFLHLHILSSTCCSLKPRFPGAVWEMQIERIWNDEVTKAPWRMEQQQRFLVP